MDNDELTERVGLIKPIFGIVRGLLEVQAKQQTLIEGLGRSFRGLLAALSGVSEPPASSEGSQAHQRAAIAQAQREIVELEALFSREQAEGETL
jgi:hypothetical protein